MRIAHIADVHYRALSRHDEYREVFTEFTRQCIASKVEAIVVAGDIFHTKTTGMSPEYIQEISWWMKELCSAAPLHLTLGNHDGNLMNLNRQDAITPIYEALKNDKNLANPIYLYKDSGVYPLDDEHNLCVYSLFDEKNWEEVRPDPQKYNIAVYHGSINKAVTEVGFVLTSDVTVDRFKDYDIVLLGDIHKTQFLGHRGGIPWIAYPGSTLQQNYAESIEHGFLLWDTEPTNRTNKVEFRRLPNPKPFVTISWNQDYSLIDVPQNARIRIKYDRPLTQVEIQGVTRYLKTNFNAAEITFSPNQLESVQEERKKSVEKLEKNIHSPESIIQLLKKLDFKDSISEKEWNVATELVTSYMRQASGKEDTRRNVKWSLRELKFDNVLGYGDDNFINFSNLAGIVGIFGSNRVGKSSIIGALNYCLFNDSDRGSIKNVDMINVRKPHCYARAVIDVGGVDHIVERQTVKRQASSGAINAITSLNLFKVIDGEEVTMNGEQRNDSDKLIRSIIGSSEDFMLTTLSTQDDLNRFIKEGSTYRKKVLNRFLDIDFFDDLFELAKADVTSVKSQLKTLQSLVDPEPSQIEAKIKNLLSEVDRLGEKREILVSKKSTKRTELEHLTSTHVPTTSKKQKLAKVAEYVELISKLEVELDRLNSRRSTLNSRITELSTELRGIDSSTSREILRSLTDLESERTKLGFRLKELTVESDRKKKSIKVLSEVPCGDSHPGCKFIKNAHLDKVELDGTLNDIRSLEENLKSLLDKIAVLNAANAEAVIVREGQLKNELSTREIELHKLDLDIQHKFERKTYLEADRDSLIAEVKKIPTIPSSIEESIEALTNELAEIESLIDYADKKLMDANVSLGVSREQLQKVNTVLSRISALNDELKIKDFISSSFSKKGLPAKILSIQLPLLNHQISQILAGVVDFGVEIECNDGSSLEIYINYGDSRRLIELCSGMEKMISSLAIRAALTTVSSIPRSDIFIIDEGFGSLDETNVEACKKLLISMKDFFKSIIIISHVPGIKDVADTIIEIQKIEKDSKVQYA